jgi:hypothetical protein
LTGTEAIGLVVILIIIGIVGLIIWKGKDLLHLRILQGSVFKQVGFLVSSPTGAQKNLFLSETGEVNMPLFPVSQTFVTSETTRRQWANIHDLKHIVMVKGNPTSDQVLIISEKSYIPQDPNNRLTPKQKEKFASLNDTARNIHMVLRAEARKAKDTVDLINTIIYGSFILDGVFGVIYLIRIKMVAG